MKKNLSWKTLWIMMLLTALFCMAAAGAASGAQQTTAQAATGGQAAGGGQAAAGAQADGASLDALAAIQERGVLRVAIPGGDLLGFFETGEDGELFGSDIDLARGIAQSMGVEVEFDRESDSHNALTEKLMNHEADLVIATYSRTLDRIRKVDFSEPYLAIHFGIMVNRQLLLTSGAGSNPALYLKNHREKIAVVGGTSHVEMAENLFPDCTIVEAEDYASASDMVKNREVFAFFCGELEFYSQYLEDEELQLYTSVYTFTDVNDEFCVGVAKGNSDLLAYINLYLETSRPVTKDGIKRRMRESYQP